MAHQRQQIREAVVALLKAAAIVAPSDVHESRTPPVRRGRLPALNVLSMDESVAEASRSSAPRELERELDLAVEIYVETTTTSDADDLLDTLAERVEQAMATDETFGGKASDSILTSTEIGIDDNGAKPLGCARLTYSVTYFTYSTATLDDLTTAHVEHGALAADHLTGLDT